MSKFKERFKDKMSIVGRDGVTVNVSTGKADSRVVPQSSTAERGSGYGSSLPPVKHVSIKPPSPSPGGQQQQQQQQQQQHHVVVRSPDSSPSPNLMTESEWLKKTAAVTQQQLLMLQQQLGVPQAAVVAIPRSNTPTSHSTAPPLIPPSNQTTTTPVKGAKVGYGRRQQGQQGALNASGQQPQPPPPSPPNRRDASREPQPRYGRRSQPVGAHKQSEQQQQQPQAVAPAKQPTYKPYTLSDYQRVNQPVKLGGLGPDDSEEKQFLRHQKDMAKKYAASVKATNQAHMTKGAGKPPPQKQPTQQQRAAAERRAKALEFAAKVPKPKITTSAAPAKEPLHIPTKAEIELQTLEEQHSRDIEAIANIKRSLGL